MLPEAGNHGCLCGKPLRSPVYLALRVCFGIAQGTGGRAGLWECLGLEIGSPEELTVWSLVLEGQPSLSSREDRLCDPLIWDLSGQGSLLWHGPLQAVAGSAWDVPRTFLGGSCDVLEGLSVLVKAQDYVQFLAD